VSRRGLQERAAQKLDYQEASMRKRGEERQRAERQQQALRAKQLAAIEARRQRQMAQAEEREAERREQVGGLIVNLAELMHSKHWLPPGGVGAGEGSRCSR
jgi:hypothetical protein